MTKNIRSKKGSCSVRCLGIGKLIVAMVLMASSLACGINNNCGQYNPFGCAKGDEAGEFGTTETTTNPTTSTTAGDTGSTGSTGDDDVQPTTGTTPCEADFANCIKAANGNDQENALCIEAFLDCAPDGSTGDTTDASTTEPPDTTTDPTTTTTDTTDTNSTSTTTTDTTSTTTSTTTTDTTTGEPAVCGNGVVEPPEECDLPPCAKGECTPQSGLCQMTAEPCLTDVLPSPGDPDRCSTMCELNQAPDVGTTGGSNGGAVDPEPEEEQSDQEAPSFLRRLFFGG